MTMVDIRDSPGPELPFRAAGDLEYRFDITRPDWSTSEKTASELGELLLEINEMGRARNPKKDRLREVMREWPEADAYTALRAILGRRFPHPTENISVDTNAVYEALGRVFAPPGADADWFEELAEDYDNVVQTLRESSVQRSDDVELRDPSLSEFWGCWMYELAEASGPNRQADLLEEMFEQLEDPWVLAQAVLNNLTLYCGSYMMLKAIRNEFSIEEPWRAWRVTGDLPAFYLEVLRGEVESELEPHDMHNTMKANSTDATEITSDDFDEGPWLGQVKYDGARLFVHHDGDGDVRAYTGGSQDVTAALPELDEIDWPDEPFIFDAEATPYDEDGNAVPFENVMTRITRDPGSGAVDPDDHDTEVVCKFFDCLYWKGRDITKRAYEDRFTIVQSVFDPDHIARTGEDLEETFYRALEDGHEGLVLKRKDGEYMPGGRHGQWRKWKPEPDTLDVKVLDAQRGGGRLSDTMGALKVGLDFEGGNVPVGWVGTGFSDSERDEFWTDYEMDRLSGQIIEVEFEEFQPNGGGWGLRFPSYQRRRDPMEASVDSVERAARLQDREEEYREWYEDTDPEAVWAHP